MKKIFNKKSMFLILIGLILFVGGGVVAVTLSANDIKYVPSDPEFNVNSVNSAVDKLYEMAKKSISTSETIVNNFSGNQLVVQNENIGKNAPGDVAISNVISPKIFSKITMNYSWWYGSGSGNYPNCKPYNPKRTIYLVDADSGETLYSVPNASAYPNGDLEIDLSSYTNDVILKVDFSTGGYSNDCTGAAKVNTVYCTIK